MDLPGAVSRPVRPPRRSQPAALPADVGRGWGRGGGSHRRHGEQYGYRTSGRRARMPGTTWTPGGASMAGSFRGAVGSGSRRPAVRGGHQPEPSRRFRHGVLAAELAAHAAAGRSPPATGRHEDREDQRRGRGRAGGGHRHRHHDGRGVKEVADGNSEHQPCDDHDGQQPTRRAGITDHGRPLFASRSRGGRASLPSYTCIAQLGRKVKTQCRPDVSAA